MSRFASEADILSDSTTVAFFWLGLNYDELINFGSVILAVCVRGVSINSLAIGFRCGCPLCTPLMIQVLLSSMGTVDDQTFVSAVCWLFVSVLAAICLMISVGVFPLHSVGRTDLPFSLYIAWQSCGLASDDHFHPIIKAIWLII